MEKLSVVSRTAVVAIAVTASLLAVRSQTGSNTSKAASGTVILTYPKDDSIIRNPERGFYMPFQPTGGGRVGQQDTPHPPLSVAELRALRQRAEGITMIRDYILIPRKYWNRDIDQSYLHEIQRNFDVVREAGLKTSIRFLYDWGLQNRDPDEATINRHLDQLQPLLKKNADVIAWVQAGLFGSCGEGDSSGHNYVYDKHKAPKGSSYWQGLSEAGRRILLKELEIIPPDRMMNVRYPRIKWDLFGWTSQNAMQNALNGKTAFGSTDAARIGYYNQGFMGNEEHYAMFQMTGEADYTAADAAFVIHEGEISNASKYKLQKGQVVTDMKKYRITALNRGGDSWPEVAAAWKANKDYDEVARRMGYRLRLVEANLPLKVRRGSPLTAQLKVANDGYARLCNPRDMELVLRNTNTKATYRIKVAATSREIRLAMPGPGETKAVPVKATIPRNLPGGKYELLLNLPDPYPSLAQRPEYSIRLANKNLWEEKTGFNKLNHTVQISD